MITTVTMPALSPTMERGKIAKWHKKEGDAVKAGDVLCEIVTDKSTLEFESIESGYLRKIIVPDGGEAQVNQGIAVITETKDEDLSSYKVEEPKGGKQEEKKPQEAKEDAIVQKSLKTSQTVPMHAFAPVPPKTSYKFPEGSIDEELTASPLAKRIAREQGLDLHSVKGSGPHGRIIAKDLEFAQKDSGLVTKAGNVPTTPPGTYEEESLSPMRSVIANRLQASKMTIPHYYITDEVNAGRMIDLRAQLKEMGIKVTFNDFVLKAVAMALRKHPEINSGYNSQNNTIIRFKTVDISLAVSIPDGLITPIINHADYKSILQLSREAKELAKKAKEGTLKPEEYQGGSFTVSNLGMFGIQSFDAVINPPQAAILAVGGIKEKALSEKGQIVSGSVMCLTLSLDHRVIDGAEGSAFLHAVRHLLEHPANLIL